MSVSGWYSANLRKVCLIEGQSATLAMDSVRIFRAVDFDDAFLRAVSLGRQSEEEYKNEEGKTVRWRLQVVLSLDSVKTEDLDGAEVHCAFVDLPSDEIVPFESEFRPQNSTPTETLG